MPDIAIESTLDNLAAEMDSAGATGWAYRLRQISERPSVSADRAAFEAWAKDNLPDALLQWSEAFGGYYLGVESNAAWKTWKYLTSHKPAFTEDLSREDMVYPDFSGVLDSERFT